MIENTKIVGDKALVKGIELSRQIEESGIKERVSSRTSEFLNKGLEIGSGVYTKTSDKFEEINVRNQLNDFI